MLSLSFLHVSLAWFLYSIYSWRVWYLLLILKVHVFLEIVSLPVFLLLAVCVYLMVSQIFLYSQGLSFLGCANTMVPCQLLCLVCIFSWEKFWTLSNITGWCFGIGLQSNKQLGCIVLQYCLEICAVISTLSWQESAYGVQFTGLKFRKKQMCIWADITTFIADSFNTALLCIIW